jgi:hypothetical protein
MLLEDKDILEIDDSRILLAHFQARPNIVDQIKIVQMKDEQLCKIRNELELGKAPSFVVN